MTSTMQDWVHGLTRMQQAVLLSSIRGPDGMRKESDAKYLIRWYRRCVMIAAFEGAAILDMHVPGGGNFTGPVPEGVDPVKKFLSAMDELPWHFITHFAWAMEIVGYKHPDTAIAYFWRVAYNKWCTKLHVRPESQDDMDRRLSDDIDKWRDTE